MDIRNCGGGICCSRTIHPLQKIGLLLIHIANCNLTSPMRFFSHFMILCRHTIIIIILIICGIGIERFEIRKAVGTPSRLSCFFQCGQKHRCEYGNYCNYNQEFDKRKWCSVSRMTVSSANLMR